MFVPPEVFASTLLIELFSPPTISEQLDQVLKWSES